MVGGFKGNLWDDTLRDSVAAFFFDERGNEKQCEALQMIFMGKAGGFPAEFAKLIGEIRGYRVRTDKIRSRKGPRILVRRHSG